MLGCLVVLCHPSEMFGGVLCVARYFSANDPSDGGSFYLQSKVHNARDTILSDLNGDGGGGEEDVYTEKPLHEDKESK